MKKWVLEHLWDIQKILTVGIFVCLLIGSAILGFKLSRKQKARVKIIGQSAYDFGVECKCHDIPSTSNPFTGHYNQQYCWLKGWSEAKCE